MIPKISDFGESVLLSRSTTMITNQPRGTPIYMAPEVFKCERYGHPADRFSFAILCWELCSESKPYDEQFNGEVNKSWEHVIKDVACNGKRPPIPWNKIVIKKEEGKKKEEEKEEKENAIIKKKRVSRKRRQRIRNAKMRKEMKEKEELDALEKEQEKFKDKELIVQKLIQDCWQVDMHRRPTWDQIIRILDSLLC